MLKLPSIISPTVKSRDSGAAEPTGTVRKRQTEPRQRREFYPGRWGFRHSGILSPLTCLPENPGFSGGL